MQNNVALLVVDVQRGFTPGGNLAVANADQIIPNINLLGQHFKHIILTQDWHPDNLFLLQTTTPAKPPMTVFSWIMALRFYGQSIVCKGHAMPNCIRI